MPADASLPFAICSPSLSVFPISGLSVFVLVSARLTSVVLFRSLWVITLSLLRRRCKICPPSRPPAVLREGAESCGGRRCPAESGQLRPSDPAPPAKGGLNIGLAALSAPAFGPAGGQRNRGRRGPALTGRSSLSFAGGRARGVRRRLLPRQAAEGDWRRPARATLSRREDALSERDAP